MYERRLRGNLWRSPAATSSRDEAAPGGRGRRRSAGSGSGSPLSAEATSPVVQSTDQHSTTVYSDTDTDTDTRHSATGREVFFDDDDLARRARTTLAGADVGMLLVADGGREICSQTIVEVHDDGGEALLTVPLASAGWLDSGRQRWGSLVLESSESFGVSLTLAGRLRPVAQAVTRLHSHHHEGAEPTVTIALQVEQVWASCPHDSGADAGARAIPLLSYASAEPDLFHANARRVVTHLNNFHHEQLRVWASGHARIDIDRIAGASISRLQRDGLQLWAITPDGAHDYWIRFPHQVETIEEFASLLRYYVAAAQGGNCG